MNNKLLVIIAWVVLIIIIGVFVLNENKIKSSNNTALNSNEETKTTNVSDNKEISNVNVGIKLSPQKCTLETHDQNSDVVSTIYLNVDKIRTDSITTSLGKKTEVHTITMNDQVYIWGDMFPNGKKTSAPEKVDVVKALNLYENNGYKCESWTPTEEIFKLPNNIGF